MDWANLERLAHQEARQTSARKMSTMSMSMSTPAFDRIASRSQSEHGTLNFGQTIRTVSQETNASLMEELSNMRKSYYSLSRNVQDIQENLTRNMDLAYDLKKGKDIVDMRCEEFDKFIKSLNANQQMLKKETESIQFLVQKIIAAQDQLQGNLFSSRDEHLSRETFSKVMDVTSAELRTVKDGVSELFKTSDRSSIQIENLLLSIIDLGSVEPATETDNLSLLRSLAAEGFAHQVRRILTESLQSGVNLSLQKHLKGFQASMNQSIVIMLKEYRERQNATLLPDMEKLKALFDEFNKVREDFVNMHSSFNSLKAQVEVERLRTAPALPQAHEIITVDETVRVDLNAARQDIEALQEQIAKLTSQMSIQSENQNASTATQETLRLSIQENRNYLISEHDKAQSKTEILIRDAESKLEDLIGRSIAPLDRKIKDVSDRNLGLSLDVQKIKEEFDRQNRDFAQQLTTQDAAVREEMKNLLHVNQLDHEEIRREIIRSIRSSEITSIQEDMTTKTEQRLQALYQEQLVFTDKLKGLGSDIDSCHSKMNNEKEDVRQLLNQRDLDISRRLQERIEHWENCQKDWQSLQEAKLEEANRQVVSLSTDMKEIKPQENIERLKDEVSNLQERLQGLRSKQDVMDIGLRKENDGLRNEFLKQLQGAQEKVQGINQLIDSKQSTNEQALKNLQDKLQGEQERLLEQLGNVSQKQRALELDINEAKDQSVRLEGKIGTLENEVHESSESKHALLDEKISSGLQILQSNLGKSIKECEMDLQLLRKDVSNMTNRIEGNHEDALQKWLGLTESYQKHVHEIDALFTDKLHKVDKDLQNTKLENDQNLQAIAAQEEQLSRLLEQHEADIKTLHDQFQRQKELHDSDMTTTRTVLRTNQQKQGKAHQEAIDEIRFDLSQTANRVLILEQTSLQLHGISTDPSNNTAGNVASMRTLTPEKKDDKESDPMGDVAIDADRGGTIDVDIISLKRECLEAMLPMLQQKAENSDVKTMKSQLEVHQQAMEQLQEWCQSCDQQVRQFEQENKNRDNKRDKSVDDSMSSVFKQNQRDIVTVQHEISVLKAEQQQQNEKFKESTKQVSEGVFPLLARQREELAGLQQSLLQLKGAVANLSMSGLSAQSAPSISLPTSAVADGAAGNSDSKAKVTLTAEPRLPLPSVPTVTLKQFSEVDQRLTSAVDELRALLENQRKEVEDMTGAVKDKQTVIIEQIANDRSMTKTSIEAVHKLLDVLQDEFGKHDDVQQQHQHVIEKLEGVQRSLQASLTTVYATLTTHIEEHARWASSQQHQHFHNLPHQHHDESHPQPPSSTSQPPSPPSQHHSHLSDSSNLETPQHQLALSSFSPQVSPHGLRSVNHLRTLCAGSRSVDGDDHHGGDDENQSVASLSSSISFSNKSQQQQQQGSRRSSRAVEMLVKDASPDHTVSSTTSTSHNQVHSHSYSNNVPTVEVHQHHQHPTAQSLRSPVKHKSVVTKELAPVMTPISQHHHQNHNNHNFRKASPALSVDSGLGGGGGMMLHQPARLVKSPALSTPGSTPSVNAPVSSGGGGGGNATLHKQAPLGPLSPAEAGSSQTNITIQPSPPPAGKAPQGSGVSPRVRVTTPSKRRSFGSPSEISQDSNAITPPKEPQTAENIMTLRSNSLEQSGDLSTNSWDVDQASQADVVEQSQASQSSFYEHSPARFQSPQLSQSMMSPMSADGSFFSSMNSSPEKTAAAANVSAQQQMSSSQVQPQQTSLPPDHARDQPEENQNSFAPTFSVAAEPTPSHQPVVLRVVDNRTQVPVALQTQAATELSEDSSQEKSTMSVGDEAAEASGTLSPPSVTGVVVVSANVSDSKQASPRHGAHEHEMEDKFVSGSSSSSSSDDDDDNEDEGSERKPSNSNPDSHKSRHANLTTLDVSDLHEEECDRIDDALPPHSPSSASSSDGEEEEEEERLPPPSRPSRAASSAAAPTMVVSGSLLGRANAYPSKKKK